MADKTLDICAYCDVPTWCWKTPKGPMCGACRVERFFDRVLYAPIGFKLMGWQREVLRGMYGPADVDSGLRKRRRAYIEVGKKNGKSFLVGGLPLYHLLMEADDIQNPEAYGVAAAKEQGALAYRAAQRLVKGNALLSDRLKVLPSTKRILRKDGHGFYAVLSADGDLQDGIEPSLALIDELHRFKTPKAQTLRDVIISGTISQKEPLVVQITTAGDVYDSPICWSEHEYARQVIDGSLQSETFCAWIWSADEERIKTDPEYWKSREARKAANPSHEDNGGFLLDEKIMDICLEAVDKPAAAAAYMRYHLNIWGQKLERWMPMDAWQSCGGRHRVLMDRECYVGIDLSKTTAMTALSLVFPDADGTYDILVYFFVPKGRVKAIEKSTHVDLSRWVKQGLVETTDGSVVDYDAVRKKVDDAASMFKVQEICYDPWNASQFVQGLVDAGYRCVEIRQGPPTLSDPMKFVLGLALEGKIRHGNHEVLNWNADCVSVRSDPNGNIAPSRDRLDRDGKMIDGMSATLNAFARIVRVKQEVSVYADEATAVM